MAEVKNFLSPHSVGSREKFSFTASAVKENYSPLPAEYGEKNSALQILPTSTGKLIGYLKFAGNIDGQIHR